jgi:hypothetical protein
MAVSDLSDEVDRIRERLTALENRVESEASLRAMMDVDQSTLTVRLDAQNRLLRALSVTQSEHTARLIRLEEGQQRHTEILDRHSEILDRHGEALVRVEGGIRDILTLLQNGGPGDSAG